MGALDKIKNVPLPFTGGYRFCGNSVMGATGHTDGLSQDYIQQPEGVRTRETMEQVYLLGDNAHRALNTNHLRNLINEWLTEDRRVLWNLHPIIGGEVLDTCLLRNVNENGTPVIIWVLKWRGQYEEAGFNLDCIWVVALRIPQAAKNVIGGWIVLGILGEYAYNRYALMSFYPGFPSVAVGFFRTCYIFSLPNLYGSYPKFSYFVRPEAEDPYWDLMPFQMQQIPDVPFAEIPTMFTAFPIKGSAAAHLVWGLSQNGQLRICSSPLTEDLLNKSADVKKLLSTLLSDNYVINLFTASTDVPNRGMSEFNGTLFVWGERRCVVVNQIMENVEGKGLQLAPVYYIAPFRGGCMGQDAICRGWNDLYIGDSTGEIYSLLRVIESGSYAMADILKPSQISSHDFTFTFASSPEFPLEWGGYRGKTIQLLYDTINKAVFVYYYWAEPRVGAELDHWVSGNYIAQTRLYTYNKETAEGSTGWSRLSTPATMSPIFETGAGLGILPDGGRAGIVYVPTKKDFYSVAPAHFFSHAGTQGWDFRLETPYFTAVSPNARLLLRALSFDIDRLATGNLKLDIVCITDNDYRKRKVEYDVPAPFTFDFSALDVGRLSNFGSQNSFMVGMKGAFLKIKIESITPPADQAQGRWAAQHLIKGMVLWVKPIGSTLYENSLQ